ncbi:hypothetical protein KGF56_001550 [Candida oxycetoniae]|uniref:FAD dependent oxidoreductase domain-containing protein n=1 Tax=Candida oxycetoniae TaxID=497107 RepID=A0AAI9SYW4_9ASCO|nr:uncharacterized protein KGF56_001550 [Candida oxycetoniae]KAI3405532.2 hypothetical protein KGF56_001550 [Candida oxycetoniae]
MSSKHIVVVGAGILGLTTALTLCESLSSDYQITVIARWGPHNPTMDASLTMSNEYTSPWAGAHFRPFPSATQKDYFEMKMTRETMKYFKKVSQTNPESSIRFVQGIEYLQNPSDLYKNCAPGYCEEMSNFAQFSDPRGFLGVKYDTWIVNSAIYLQYLYRKLLVEHSVKFITAELNSLQDINKFVFGRPIIVNCSGTGLNYYGGNDPKYIPVRGQTLLINPPKECPYMDKTITYQLADGSWIFVIPRPLNGGIILGGTKQVGDTCLKIRESDSKHLLQLGKKYFPDLMKATPSGEKYFDIIRINVGLRPMRRGGLKVDLEKHNGQFVVNNYGAGGMGYELSYGSSLKVLELVNSAITKSKL